MKVEVRHLASYISRIATFVLAPWPDEGTIGVRGHDNDHDDRAQDGNEQANRRDEPERGLLGRKLDLLLGWPSHCSPS
jgi:hypothetical protein